MLYDIFVNEKLLATIGPSTLQHLSVSVSTSGEDDETFLFANGFSDITEHGHQTHFTWMEKEIKPSDTVRIAPSQKPEPSETLKTREIRRGVKATRDDLFCDFCKQSQEIVGAIVQSGETPFICGHCAELCLEIVKGRDDERT
jgi:hypothetical protein